MLELLWLLSDAIGVDPYALVVVVAPRTLFLFDPALLPRDARIAVPNTMTHNTTRITAPQIANRTIIPAERCCAMPTDDTTLSSKQPINDRAASILVLILFVFFLRSA
jgi:hypothetical protein